MPIVRKIDGEWVRLSGVHNLPVKGEFFKTRLVTYHDERKPIEEDCEPYPVKEQVDIGKIEQFVREGIWGADDLARFDGVAVAEPFVPPEGKQAIGEASYVEGKNGVVSEAYEVEDIPLPPPPPTAEEKLAAAGLTEDELDGVIARSNARLAAKK